MTKTTDLTKTATTAVCISLCVVLPLALHFIPAVGSFNLGVVLSPMHLPVLLCGLICGWSYGLACGIIGPFLSSLITSMPGWAKLPTMMVELALYGLISGALIELIRTGRQILDLYISLILAMLTGRIFTGIIRAFIFAPRSEEGVYTIQAWATGYFVSAFPGIIMQLILIPILYVGLQRAKLVPYRYQNAKNKD